MAIIDNPVAIVSTGGGGSIVNGIIKQYKASTSDISANTFVEFVSKIIANDKNLSSTGYGGNSVSAVLLSDNTVFIAHNGGNVASNTASRLYGVVCTISNNIISVGTDTLLSSTTFGGAYVSAVLLSEGKVFIAHNGDGSYNNTASRLYGVVCTISGNTITAGTDTLLSSTTFGGIYVSSMLISAGKVFIAHNGDGSYNNTASRLYGVVCTISGNTITAGADTLLTSTTFGGIYPSLALLGTDKIFISHNGNAFINSTTSLLYGVVCTISNTTITAGTDTILSYIYTGAPSVSVSLSANKVFVAHNGGNLANNIYSRLYGVVCTISNTTITAGTDTMLSSVVAGAYYGTFYTWPALSAVLLQSGRVFIAHNGDDAGTNSGLYGAVCEINGDNILLISDTRITMGSSSGSSPSAVLLSSERIFIAHNGAAAVSSTSSRLRGVVVNSDAVAEQAVNKIDGLTKDNITTTTAGDIWVLNS